MLGDGEKIGVRWLERGVWLSRDETIVCFAADHPLVDSVADTATALLLGQLMARVYRKGRAAGVTAEREGCALACEARKKDCGDDSGALAGDDASCTCDKCERCYEDDECARDIRARSAGA